MIITLYKSWKTDDIINKHNILTISDLKTLRLVFYSLLVSEISKRPHCSVAQSCLTLCDPMDCSTSGFPILHHLLEFAQTHVHWVSDTIQAFRPVLSPSPPAFHLSQHQGLFRGVHSSHQVAKVLELQLHHQSFQWIFRVDFLRLWYILILLCCWIQFVDIF